MTAEQQQDERYLTIAQVAEMLSVSQPTIRRWVRDGTFPQPVKLPTGTRRWRASDVQKWAENEE